MVALDGVVDSAAVAKAGGALRRLAQRRRPFIVDLNGLTLLDAGGILGLIGILQEADDGQGRLALVCCRPTGLRLLQRWRVVELAPVFVTVEAAIDEAAASDRRSSEGPPLV